MALTLRDIIVLNDSSGKGFREQVEGCRHPDFFAERNIRSMAAWEGFRYPLRTDTESETQTRYSDWTCDTPAVNGRRTRIRYTDSRSRTRTVWSDGTFGTWGDWSAWQQMAAETEEAFDGNACPYILRHEYRNDRTNGGAYCEQAGGANTGNLIQPRAHDYCAVYSNGTASVVRTETYDQKTYDTTSCPVKPTFRFSLRERRKSSIGTGGYDEVIFAPNFSEKTFVGYAYKEFENGELVKEGSKPVQYAGTTFSVNVPYTRDLELTILSVEPYSDNQGDYIYPVGYSFYSPRNR